MPESREASHAAHSSLFSATVLVLIVLAARLVYLRWLSPWELVADEAHYWEWSRRLDWSYYTKGPGVAWVIWLSTAVAGVSEFAVRAPAAIAAALMTFIGARFAADATDDDRDLRAPFYVALALLVAPTFVSLSQLLTTDIFCATGWLAVSWLAFRAVRPGVTPNGTLAYLSAAGFVLGVACLFKYTAVLLLPGLALFFWVERRRLAHAPSRAAGLVGATILFSLAASPIVIWNVSRHWPTIAHQVGRLRLPGGDESVQWNWSPLWFFSFVGAQLALLGVVGAVLIVWAAWRERRARRDNTLTDTRALAGSLLLCSSTPLLGFYLVISLFREAQGNWASVGYSTLLTFLGIAAAEAMRDHREVVRAWRALPEPRPRRGWLKRQPETPFQVAWHWYLGIGCVAAVAIAMGPKLATLPGLSQIDGLRRAAKRANGASEKGLAVGSLVREHVDAAGRPPLLIADHYQDASLIAFYTPGHPRVFCAGSAMGSRPNAYDFFADTDLSDPALQGRDALLFGADNDQWLAAFRFESVTPSAALKNTFIAHQFAGPLTTAPGVP